jgi:ABC-type nitrate/sulfonate/bicarbonate transport system permease component
MAALAPAREATPARLGRDGAAARLLPGFAGMVAAVGLWWVLAVTVFAAGRAVPTPLAVVRRLLSDGWHFYGPNVTSTATEALQGFLWGNAIAIALAILVLLVPWLERLALQLAIASYCLPIIAIGPILTIVFSGRAPMVALAALSVFFTTLVGTLLGLRAADRTSLDLVSAYGGGRWQQLRRVQLIAALPSVFGALKIAAPAAFLGAIIGEWLGTGDHGLGIAMVVAEQQLETSRTWGVALLCGLIAGLGYAIVAVVSKLVTPWVAGSSRP